MDMPIDAEMLRNRRMNEAILAAYEAGKSAERFFDRGAPGRPSPGEQLNGTGDLDRADSPGWHH